MNIVVVTTLLSSCIPSLMKIGEQVAESASSEIGAEAWETAKKIWGKLYPKLAEKDDARIAAEQLAAKPESDARKAVFQEELETLLKEHPDLAEAIAQVMQENDAATEGKTNQITQTIANNEGQAIAQMTNSKAIGKIEGGVQGDVNL